MELHLTFGVVSYLSSTLLFIFVLIVYFVGFKVGETGKPFLFLICASLVWSALLTMSQIGASIAFEMVVAVEMLRYYTWFYVLQTTTSRYLDKQYQLTRLDILSPLIISALFLVALTSLAFNDVITESFQFQSAIILQICWLLGFSIIGLILVVRLYRNTDRINRDSVVYLCASAGAILAYDVFVYSNSVITQSMDNVFWSARGIVNVLVLPILVVAAVRNPAMAPNLHISRQFIFHSIVLVSTGVYLVLISAIGFYVKSSSGEWGNLLQAVFLFAALLLLVFLFMSRNLRVRIKRYLSMSFRHKYDYREEWRRFSETLLQSDQYVPLENRALQAIAQIVNSPSAILWIKEDTKFVLRSRFMLDDETAYDTISDENLFDSIANSSEPIEYVLLRSKISTNLSLVQFFDQEKCWLLVPLKISDEVYGMVQLSEPVVELKLDIEDMELIPTVAHHVALSLFSKETDLALQYAERFREVNQMTAFLVHDLKTVLSQLSLLSENAGEHRHNPAFVDDMVLTVENAVQKMQRLIQQIKNPEKMDGKIPVPVIELIEAIISDYSTHNIQPQLEVVSGGNPVVQANDEELGSAIGHIVQNAVESISARGSVSIRVDPNSSQDVLIEITDTGRGMDQAFILERLFRPFDSTKGVSGMGVGVFQSREYIRSIGGDIRVTSEPGEGSCFAITIPKESEA